MGNNNTEVAKNNANRPRPGLLDRTVDIEPIGVIYNVPGSAVQDFITDYLTKVKGINGIETVRVAVKREGIQRPEVSLYVIIDPDSEEIISNLGNVPSHLKKKMDEAQYKISDKLKNALYPITRDFKLFYYAPEKLLYIKADIFKALGLMFKSDPTRFDLTIAKVEKLKKKDCVLSVVKEVKFIDNDDGNFGDRFDTMISRIEYRDYDDD